MSLKDVAELIHFRELHLLPRTVFSIGAVCFIGSFFIRAFLVGFLGVGLIFVALTLNFAIQVLLQTDIYLAKKTFAIPWMMLAQFILCSAITYKLLVLIFYFYRHGEMPPYLQPLPPSN
ncbi:MAG: hypothetical protein WA857_06650 [Candidatus Acidiferrum sp.]